MFPISIPMDKAEHQKRTVFLAAYASVLRVGVDAPI